MTRDEWIQRYVAAMKLGGSQLPDLDLIERAESGCDATEQTGRTDPNFWEDPETIADEHLEAE